MARTAWTNAWQLTKDTFVSWSRDHASFLAAGISYYTVFSLAPLLIFAVAVAGLVLGEAAVEGIVAAQLQGFVGESAAKAIQSFVLSAKESGMGAASVLGALLLLFGASRLFAHIQIALNMVWGVEPHQPLVGFRGKIRKLLVKRLITFGMVLGVGILLLVFFFIDAMLGLVRNLLGDAIPILGHVGLWKMANFAVSVCSLTLLSAFVFKFLPDSKIRWRDVWVGSAVTAVLLGVGRLLINLYFQFSNVGSAYGVAGSFVIVFVAVYLSAQIFLFGAEFTWVYAHRRGSRAGHGLPEKRKLLEGTEEK